MKQHIGLLLASSLLTLFATSAQSIDLVQVHQLALEEDAQLMIARSKLESARYTLPQAQSANRPQIDLTANATFQDNDNSLTYDDQQSGLGFTLSLLQNLYNPEITAQADAVEATIMQSEAEYKLALQDLLVRVSEAYFNILSERDNVEFADAEKNAIGRQLEQAKKRFEVGLIAITDVKEAQASYDLSVSQELIAFNALDNAREAMRLLIGKKLSEPLTPLGDGIKLLIPEPANANAWVEQARKSNFTLASAQAALKAANENRKIARAGGGPKVNFNASYQNNMLDSDVNGSFGTSDITLGVQLNMPLYTGGRTGAAVSQAEADYTTAQNNLLLQNRLISQQTSTAYLAVVSGIGQVKALKQALISTKAALEATEAGFDVGTRTSVDVLNSLRETYRSQRDYASARYDYLVNILKLKQAAGLLDEPDLAGINQWLTQ